MNRTRRKGKQESISSAERINQLYSELLKGDANERREARKKKEAAENESIARFANVEANLDKIQLSEFDTHFDDQCVRRLCNFSGRYSHYLFDSGLNSQIAAGNPRALAAGPKVFDAEELSFVSPKMNKLIEEIQRLDEEDRKNFKTTFKHFIYTDVRDSYFGAKMITSCLLNSLGLTNALTADPILESNWSPPKDGEMGSVEEMSELDDADRAALREQGSDVGDDNQDDDETDEDYVVDLDGGSSSNEKYWRNGSLRLKTEKELEQTPGNNIVMMSTLSVFRQTFGKNLQREIIRRFNNRENNVLGQQIRFIVLDGSFKEGVDLFDVKYVHLFEVPQNYAFQKQTIGRAIRMCGQAGLPFQPGKGWPILVNTYDTEIPKSMQYKFLDKASTNDLYLYLRNKDQINLMEKLEEFCQEGAVDKDLNSNIHDKAKHVHVMEIVEKKKMKPKPPALTEEEKKRRKEQRRLQERLNKLEKKKGGYLERDDAVIGEPELAAIRNFVYPSTLDMVTGDLSAKAFQDIVDKVFSNPVYHWPVLQVVDKCNKPVEEEQEPEDEQQGQQQQQLGGAYNLRTQGNREPRFEDTTKLRVLNYHPTQYFVRDYFTPNNTRRGILLWHSPGSGKTCTAIATASATFVDHGYRILWITKHNLLPFFANNIFVQSCFESLRLREDDEIDVQEKKRILKAAKFLDALSYRAFSNAMSNGNKGALQKLQDSAEAAYRRDNLADKSTRFDFDTTHDLLYKTLIIIDEAHKLVANEDMSVMERPNFKAIQDAIHRSFARSGLDSCRVMLMTATPMVNSPLDLTKLLNLLREPGLALPDADIATLQAQYFMTETEGKQDFLRAIAGYISYLDRANDATQFAQPIMQKMVVPIFPTKDETLLESFAVNADSAMALADYSDELQAVKNRIEELEAKVLFLRQRQPADPDNKRWISLVANAKRDFLQEARELKVYYNEVLFRGKKLQNIVKRRATTRRKRKGDDDDSDDEDMAASKYSKQGWINEGFYEDDEVARKQAEQFRKQMGDATSYQSRSSSSSRESNADEHEQKGKKKEKEKVYLVDPLQDVFALNQAGEVRVRYAENVGNDFRKAVKPKFRLAKARDGTLRVTENGDFIQILADKKERVVPKAKFVPDLYDTEGDPVPVDALQKIAVAAAKKAAAADSSDSSPSTDRALLPHVLSVDPDGIPHFEIIDGRVRLVAEKLARDPLNAMLRDPATTEQQKTTINFIKNNVFQRRRWKRAEGALVLDKFGNPEEKNKARVLLDFLRDAGGMLILDEAGNPLLVPKVYEEARMAAKRQLVPLFEMDGDGHLLDPVLTEEGRVRLVDASHYPPSLAEKLRRVMYSQNGQLVISGRDKKPKPRDGEPQFDLRFFLVDRDGGYLLDTENEPVVLTDTLADDYVRRKLLREEQRQKMEKGEAAHKKAQIVAQEKADKARMAAEEKAEKERKLKEAKAEKARQALEEKAEKERKVQEAKAEKARQALEEKAEKERKVEEAKAEKERKLQEAKAEKDRKVAEEKAEKERKLQEAKAEKDRKVAEEKAEKERKLQEAKAEKDRKVAEEKAEKERKLQEQRVEKERRLAEEKAAMQREREEKKRQQEQEKQAEQQQKQVNKTRRVIAAAPPILINAPIRAAPAAPSFDPVQEAKLAHIVRVGTNFGKMYQERSVGVREKLRTDEAFAARFWNRVNELYEQHKPAPEGSAENPIVLEGGSRSNDLGMRRSLSLSKTMRRRPITKVQIFDDPVDAEKQRLLDQYSKSTFAALLEKCKSKFAVKSLEAFPMVQALETEIGQLNRSLEKSENQLSATLTEIVDDFAVLRAEKRVQEAKLEQEKQQKKKIDDRRMAREFDLIKEDLTRKREQRIKDTKAAFRETARKIKTLRKAKTDELESLRRKLRETLRQKVKERQQGRVEEGIERLTKRAEAKNRLLARELEDISQELAQNIPLAQK